jgi:hypothetical protein
LQITVCHPGENHTHQHQKGIVNPVAEGLPQRGTHLHVVVLLLVLNLASAALFIALINRPVYDDGYNIYDVHNYAAKGLSLNTLRSQRNAPGPTSFIWMATAVRLIGADELRGARIGTFLSWLLLGIGVLLGARFSRYPELWHGALLTLLVFPHAVKAASTVLTEGPALFFALLGALAWTESVFRADSGATTLLCGMLGGLFLGIAVTCRQYNIALLPAAALLAVWQFRTKAWRPLENWRWACCAVLSLVLSAVPVLLLVFAWKGIATPGIESGASYNMMYKAGAGLNIARPFIAALYDWSVHHFLCNRFPHTSIPSQPSTPASAQKRCLRYRYGSARRSCTHCEYHILLPLCEAPTCVFMMLNTAGLDEANQLFTRFAVFTGPKPVAKYHPVIAS